MSAPVARGHGHRFEDPGLPDDGIPGRGRRDDLNEVWAPIFVAGRGMSVGGELLARSSQLRLGPTLRFGVAKRRGLGVPDPDVGPLQTPIARSGAPLSSVGRLRTRFGERRRPSPPTAGTPERIASATMPPGPPPADELHQLVTKATSGDAPALDALLLSFLPRLRRFVRLRTNELVRQRESCSDLVQSVCREVLEGAGDFEYRGDAAFRAWLFRTALNKILERTRGLTQQKRDVRREVDGEVPEELRSPPGRDPTPSQIAVANELQRRMELAFDLLPDEYREVITLSRIVGLSHAEIGEHIGRSAGATRMLLSRALVAYVEAMERVQRGELATDG